MSGRNLPPSPLQVQHRVGLSESRVADLGSHEVPEGAGENDTTEAVDRERVLLPTQGVGEGTTSKERRYSLRGKQHGAMLFRTELPVAGAAGKNRRSRVAEEDSTTERLPPRLGEKRTGRPDEEEASSDEKKPRTAELSDSLKAIPVGRVATLKQKLERRMERRRQRQAAARLHWHRPPEKVRGESARLLLPPIIARYESLEESLSSSDDDQNKRLPCSNGAEGRGQERHIKWMQLNAEMINQRRHREEDFSVSLSATGTQEQAEETRTNHASCFPLSCGNTHHEDSSSAITLCSNLALASSSRVQPVGAVEDPSYSAADEPESEVSSSSAAETSPGIVFPLRNVSLNLENLSLSESTQQIVSSQQLLLPDVEASSASSFEAEGDVDASKKPEEQEDQPQRLSISICSRQLDSQHSRPVTPRRSSPPRASAVGVTSNQHPEYTSFSRSSPPLASSSAFEIPGEGRGSAKTRTSHIHTSDTYRKPAEAEENDALRPRDLDALEKGTQTHDMPQGDRTLFTKSLVETTEAEGHKHPICAILQPCMRRESVSESPVPEIAKWKPASGDNAESKARDLEVVSSREVTKDGGDEAEKKGLDEGKAIKTDIAKGGGTSQESHDGRDMALRRDPEESDRGMLHPGSLPSVHVHGGQRKQSLGEASARMRIPAETRTKSRSPISSRKLKPLVRVPPLNLTPVQDARESIESFLKKNNSCSSGLQLVATSREHSCTVGPPLVLGSSCKTAATERGRCRKAFGDRTTGDARGAPGRPRVAPQRLQDSENGGSPERGACDFARKPGCVIQKSPIRLLDRRGRPFQTCREARKDLPQSDGTTASSLAPQTISLARPVQLAKGGRDKTSIPRASGCPDTRVPLLRIPISSRVVRCSTSLFTARVCTILEKELEEGNRGLLTTKEAENPVMHCASVIHGDAQEKTEHSELGEKEGNYQDKTRDTCRSPEGARCDTLVIVREEGKPQREHNENEQTDAMQLRDLSPHPRSSCSSDSRTATDEDKGDARRRLKKSAGRRARGDRRRHTEVNGREGSSTGDKEDTTLAPLEEPLLAVMQTCFTSSPSSLTSCDSPDSHPSSVVPSPGRALASASVALCEDRNMEKDAGEAATDGHAHSRALLHAQIASSFESILLGDPKQCRMSSSNIVVSESSSVPQSASRSSSHSHRRDITRLSSFPQERFPGAPRPTDSEAGSIALVTHAPEGGKEAPTSTGVYPLTGGDNADKSEAERNEGNTQDALSESSKVLKEMKQEPGTDREEEGSTTDAWSLQRGSLEAYVAVGTTSSLSSSSSVSASRTDNFRTASCASPTKTPSLPPASSPSGRSVAGPSRTTRSSPSSVCSTPLLPQRASSIATSNGFPPGDGRDVCEVEVAEKELGDNRGRRAPGARGMSTPSAGGMSSAPREDESDGEKEGAELIRMTEGATTATLVVRGRARDNRGTVVDENTLRSGRSAVRGATCGRGHRRIVLSSNPGALTQNDATAAGGCRKKDREQNANQFLLFQPMRRPPTRGNSVAFVNPSEKPTGSADAINKSRNRASPIAIFASAFWSHVSADAEGSDRSVADGGIENPNAIVDSQAQESKQFSFGFWKGSLQVDSEEPVPRGSASPAPAASRLQPTGSFNKQVPDDDGHGSPTRPGEDANQQCIVSGDPSRWAHMHVSTARSRAGPLVPQGSTRARAGCPLVGRRSVAQPVAWSKFADGVARETRVSGLYGSVGKRSFADCLAFLDTSSTETPSTSTVTSQLSEADGTRSSCGGSLPSTNDLDEMTTMEREGKGDGASERATARSSEEVCGDEQNIIDPMKCKDCQRVAISVGSSAGASSTGRHVATEDKRQKDLETEQHWKCGHSTSRFGGVSEIQQDSKKESRGNAPSNEVSKSPDGRVEGRGRSVECERNRTASRGDTNTGSRRGTATPEDEIQTGDSGTIRVVEAKRRTPAPAPRRRDKSLGADLGVLPADDGRKILDGRSIGRERRAESEESCISRSGTRHVWRPLEGARPHVKGDISTQKRDCVDGNHLHDDNGSWLNRLAGPFRQGTFLWWTRGATEDVSGETDKWEPWNQKGRIVGSQRVLPARWREAKPDSGLRNGTEDETGRCEPEGVDAMHALAGVRNSREPSATTDKEVP
uniref:Uncharacterized protein n=1 Tax=Toxoplasma gondii COUG TaxID=1074873 RepID=A0A2G8XZ55_TOXGO|nr:hypothetical protein TGCOUG_285425 [Toxoplasma gondii COUG]